MSAIVAYAVGLFVFTWALWFANEWRWTWYRCVEAALWPLAVVAGTVRKLADISREDLDHG